MNFKQNFNWERVALVFVVFYAAIYFFTLKDVFAPQTITEENLSGFKSAVEKKLLFYDPNLDADFLSESVSKMRKADDMILYVNALVSGEKNAALTERRLWPEDFLSELATVHVVSKQFLASPSPVGANALLDSYEKAAFAYKKAADLNIRAFDALFAEKPNLPKSKILFFGSAATFQIIRNDFALIRKNANKIFEEIAQYKKCLYGGACANLADASANEANLIKKTAAAVSAFDPVPKEIFGISPDRRLYGPYWVETRCFGANKYGESPARPFYIAAASDAEKTRRIKAHLADEKYYRDYSSIPEEPAAKFGLSRGIFFAPQSETNDYMCTDLRYLAELYGKFLSERTGAKSLNNLFVLPYLIENTLSVSRFPIYYSLLFKIHLDVQYLLGMRSAYSLYFGTFSPAVWRLPEEPQFLLDGEFSLRKGYVAYGDLVKRGFSKDEMAKFKQTLPLADLYRAEIFVSVIR